MDWGEDTFSYDHLVFRVFAFSSFSFAVASMLCDDLTRGSKVMMMND